MQRICRELVLWLLSADKADAEGEGQALSAGEGAEIGGVDIVDYGVGILAVEDVDGFDADSPEIAAESEFLFEADIEAGIGGEAGGVGRADELLLEINDAEGVTGAVLKEIAQLDAPEMRGRPAPGDEAVGSVPEDGAGLLRDIEDRAECRIEDFVGVGDGASVGAIDFHVFRENVADGDGGGAIAVFAGVLQKKNSSGLRGLLIDVG